ncbi:ligand-binding protein, receptor family [Ancylostoma duodenale]|uniref:Ligand-binding protein, receptor family n=1 Tax=Ancylostoma duodenale TaxID=51022 RepID=A0A0C2G981_9BILA|nr:ligand-binding protein, receptor family [Ancylostoma duodenale]
MNLVILLANLFSAALTKVLNVGLLCAYKDTTLTQGSARWCNAPWVGIALLSMPLGPCSLTWAMGDCIESTDAGAVIGWIESGADVVLGPACSASAIISGTVAKYYDFPIVIWAPTFSSAILNNDEYPTIMASTWSSIKWISFSQAQTLMRLFERYQWKEVAVVYYSSRSDLIPRCSLVVKDLENLMNDSVNTTMTYRRQLQNITNSTFKTVLRAIKDVSRITVVCLESDEARRNLFIAIAEEGMDTNEYMWLMIESRKLGYNQVWKDKSVSPDGKDAVALRTARKFFVIDAQPLNASAQFIADIKAKMRQPPYNCADCTSIDPKPDHLVLGFSGTVIINNNFTRDPVFLVYGLDPSDQPIVLMRIVEQLDNNSIGLIQEIQSQSVIWANHGGSPPLNRPKCDFDGSACPLSFVEQYLAITLVAAIVPVIIIIAAVFFIMR